ncbi:MAG: 1-acyl-sn-glycerol-3-phosphate acyltransferase [Caulobacteraceae bacterium]
MVYQSAAPSLIREGPRRAHIVDRLIAERAPRLAAGAAWPLVRPLLYGLLDYGKARRMADAIAPLGGRQALAFISDLLGVKVEVRGLERVPRPGRAIAICNHPTGMADGVAVYDALKAVRPDLMFYANADARRVAPGLDEVLIPVEWREEMRTRAGARLTLNLTREAMEAERLLVVFPAGRLARRRGGTLADPAWTGSAFSVARKYAAPILPMHLSGPRSSLFHFFDGFSGELRDITLFHELLNKRGKTFRLTIGPAVPPGRLPADAGEAAAAMKAYVERGLPANPESPFA